LGQAGQALGILNKGLPINPGVPMAYLNRGLASELLNNEKEAYADFLRILRMGLRHLVLSKKLKAHGLER